jgi:hypothetical protein
MCAFMEGKVARLVSGTGVHLIHTNSLKADIIGGSQHGGRASRLSGTCGTELSQSTFGGAHLPLAQPQDAGLRDSKLAGNAFEPCD